MAEDQGVNGDKWNDYVIHLLSQFGWEQVGDTNMDLKGEDDQSGGIDAIMIYEQPGKSLKRSVIVESKRYKKSSYSANKLYGWLSVLNNKLDFFRNSEAILEQYPFLQDCEEIKHGIIFNWITDADDDFLDLYKKHFLAYPNKTSATLRGGKRISVLNNERINKLRSILEVMESRPCRFFYPSQLTGTNSGAYKEVLTLEYMFSNIILAEESNNNANKIVFYFGEMTYEALRILSECLNLYQFLIEDTKMTIYYYQDDDNIRKIIPSVKEKLFPKVDVSFEVLLEFQINKEPKFNKKIE